jgi:hypothetical protein
MPKLDGILETTIHTEDMVRARAVYEDVLGLEPIYSDNRLSAYRWPDAMCSWSSARARRSKPLRCLAGPPPAIAAMVHCMWRSPSAETNSIVGRRILLRAVSPSKGVTIDDAVDAASISAIPTGTFWSLHAGIVVGVLGATREKSRIARNP